MPLSVSLKTLSGRTLTGINIPLSATCKDKWCIFYFLFISLFILEKYRVSNAASFHLVPVYIVYLKHISRVYKQTYSVLCHSSLIIVSLNMAFSLLYCIQF